MRGIGKRNTFNISLSSTPHTIGDLIITHWTHPLEYLIILDICHCNCETNSYNHQVMWLKDLIQEIEHFKFLVKYNLLT